MKRMSLKVSPSGKQRNLCSDKSESDKKITVAKIEKIHGREGHSRKFEYFLFNPSRPDPRRREKINLSFYFHTSLWCLKRFYEGLKVNSYFTKTC